MILLVYNVTVDVHEEFEVPQLNEIYLSVHYALNLDNKDKNGIWFSEIMFEYKGCAVNEFTCIHYSFQAKGGIRFT